MSRMLTIGSRPLLALLLCAYHSVLWADLILTAPPRENAEEGSVIYGPIARHIESIIGEKVHYKHPENWLNYQQQMRQGKFDIVFDGPHFMSWRMANIKHTPLAKLEGQLRFVLIVKKDKTAIRRVEDLVGRKICGLPPPNLATLTIYSEFPNPVRQPNFIGVQGGFNKVYLAFQSGRCEAAVFRDSYYQAKVPEADKPGLKIIYTSAPLPNQGFTVNTTKLSPQMRYEIVQSLLTDAGIEASQPLLQRFAKQTNSLLPASEQEYRGHNRFIEGVIFGW